MKQRLLDMRARIDALSLRERGMLFAAAVALIAFAASYLVFAPMAARQGALRAQIAQQNLTVASIDAEITQKVQAHAVDPDAALRARLAAVQDEAMRSSTRLKTMRSGLVAPERMAPLLEKILAANGKLQLESMNTLPPDTPSARSTAAATGGATPRRELLFRHGVQVAVRGNYLDMVDYMDALENMPNQVFWGRARLEVDRYPSARLTLTLYTLSLDPTWLTL